MLCTVDSLVRVQQLTSHLFLSTLCVCVWESVWDGRAYVGVGEALEIVIFNDAG